MYMNQKGMKKVFQIGPNYAAGKDMLQGMRNDLSRAKSSARK